jgi:hypothetical protein
MKNVRFTSLVFLAALVSTPALPKNPKHAPLPRKIVAARTVYIDNQTDSPNVKDKAYVEIVKRTAWRVVEDRAEADIIIVFSRIEGASPGRLRRQAALLAIANGAGDAADAKGRQAQAATATANSASGSSTVIVDSSTPRPRQTLADLPPSFQLNLTVRDARTGETLWTESADWVLVCPSGKLTKRLLLRIAESKQDRRAVVDPEK